MKRYAIVRVDDKCPPMLERKLKVCSTENNCFNGKCPYENIYGDTKEQLIMKIAQALEQNCFKCSGFVHLTRKIVEFLGVEE